MPDPKEQPTVEEQRNEALRDVMAEQPAPEAPDDPEETGDNATDWQEEGEAEEPPKQPPGTVPTAAVHEERERRRAETDRADRLQREFDEFRGVVAAQFRQLEQRNAPPSPDAEPEIEVPDPNEDLAGYLAAVEQLRQRHERQQAEQTKQINEWIEHQKQGDEQHQRRQGLMQSVAQHEQQFRAQMPDYDQALHHLANEMVADYQTEQLIPLPQAQKIVTDSLVAIAEQALSQRKNPAQVLYALAQRRQYAAAVAQSPGGGVETAAHAQNGSAAPSPPQQQRRQPSAAAMAEGAMPGGGGPPVSGNSLQALLDASEADLAAGKIDWRKTLGG